ncbi:MAG: mannose-1-phosphate guanylyltransferase [Prevotella sp.]|nr:mannose-1-phosphate guanylyltransferase [Prevotella sp.]
MNNNNFCVILSGGRGRRLWPCSRHDFPKQFMDFFGTGRSQLQQTYDRFLKIIPKDNIFVSTNDVYASIVREQLPDMPEDNILNEPIYRNTAPSAAWACYRISHICPDANVIVTPSDQAVINEEGFFRNIQDGLNFVTANDGLLTLGVRPTRPEPGYGYIQMGEHTEYEGIYKVKSFTEKPEREFAQLFMASNEFYWNTGIFMSRVTFLRESLKKVLPVVFRTIDKDDINISISEEQEYVKENFPRFPNMSVDFGILEKSKDVYLMNCDFGWADLGTWHGIYEAMEKGEGDNVVLDSDVILENSSNNIIRVPKDKLAVINGLDGFIVAEHGNVLLICKKEDSSAMIRKYISEVEIKLGEEFT